MTQLILRSDADGVATLTLNRPDKRNAINRELFRALRAQILALQDDAAIGLVVLRGSGGHFCAGHDLTEKPHADALGWLRRELQTLEMLTRLRQPVIAAVEGTCFTGGLEMALSADFIVCDETARFADTHGKWGLVPGWGMSQRLPRRVGQWKAREISFTGLPVSGPEAARIGLANHCLPDAELEARTMEMAEAIAAQSRHSVFAYKRLYTAQADLPLEAGLAWEIVNSAGVGPDMAERVSGRFG